MRLFPIVLATILGSKAALTFCASTTVCAFFSFSALAQTGSSQTSAKPDLADIRRKDGEEKAEQAARQAAAAKAAEEAKRANILRRENERRRIGVEQSLQEDRDRMRQQAEESSRNYERQKAFDEENERRRREADAERRHEEDAKFRSERNRLYNTYPSNDPSSPSIGPH
jgi:type IV secretory pathway VirB10-like protein